MNKSEQLIMEPLPPRILVVDDEPFNLEILSEHLEDEGYSPVCAESGEQAWDTLADDQNFGAILLDWMMPGMDGLELLNRIKQHEDMKAIPVIMQTAKADKESVDAGVEAGAYYYLSKPFDKSTLLRIVHAAIEDQQVIGAQAGDSTEGDLAPADDQITIQSLEDVKTVTQLIANAYPDNPQMILGLTELLINAIEHGNLGISYAEKGRLLSSGAWQDEVNRRLQLDEHKHKQVTLTLIQTDHQLQLHIKDEGPGFDWQSYMDFSSDRAYDAHGRGIAMANTMSFESLQYLGNGNEVIATVTL